MAVPFDVSATDEIVDIVDREDRVVDQVPRHVMREQGLCHRVTYILVFDSSGRLFVQQRTLTKDLYPGFHDLAAGGVVRAGESYEESAARELAEELGIVDKALRYHFKTYFEESDNRCWGKVYSCIHDGPFVLQEEEVASGEFVDVKQVIDGGISPVTPDTRAVFTRYMNR